MLTVKDNLFYFIYLHRTGLTVTALSVVLLLVLFVRPKGLLGK
jgi:hypothetical protein